MTGISEEHERDVLIPRALSAVQAEVYGVRSVDDISTVPGFEQHRYARGSGLLFTWHSPLSGEVLQFRPDEPVNNPEGDPVKYVFAGGTTLVLNRLRDNGDGPLLIAEGTLQSIAAATYTHDGWAVYGISGCWSWRRGDTTVATPDLLVTEGRDVVIALDADASTNLDVYNAGMALRSAIEAEGANSVHFARLDGHGRKAGLDDILGARPEPNRAGYLSRMLQRAGEKLADKPPPRRQRSAPILATTADRPMVVVNGDRREVIEQLTDALVRRWSGDELFDYGGILARRTGSAVAPVTKGVFADLVAEATMCVSVNAKGDATHQWPDEKSCDATLSRAARFARLDRISRVPFVRADGSVCQVPGYDADSSGYLVLDEHVAAVQVPERPNEDDVASAVKLLCEEWLGDLFAIMPEPEDRANCLALVLTPFVRGLVPLVPMAVVDGLQMGVGKNLLADVVSILAHGVAADPLPYSADDDENRKVITANFRSGADLFVFDEAHVIEGRHLAKAITSVTYTDRILGVSNMVEFPNRVTWLALGNNVSVNGDLARRVYRIRLAPTGENPQDRDSASFRHPDLRKWTKQHRHELVAACLTLVRAWFASAPEGQRVESAAGRRFGSFEQWGGMVGGILEHAGVPGFLGSLIEWRSETDFEAQWWVAHLAWLRRVFGDAEFTTAEVVAKMKREGHGKIEHPPRLDDHDARGYGRSLGLAYGRIKNRFMAGHQLIKTFESPGHGNRWKVTHSDDTLDSTGDGTGSRVDTVDRVDPYLPTREKNRVNTCGGRVFTGFSSPESDPGSSHTTQSTRPPAADPLAVLVPLLHPAPVRECPDCEQPEELTPSGLWMACRACHPASFA